MTHLKRTIWTALLLGISGLWGSSAFAQQAAYTIDNSHTSVIFSVSHLGYSYCYGRFNKVEGTFSLDSAKPQASTFDVTIDANTVDTNDEKRDQHLRGPDFFDSKQFPTITFKSESVSTTEDGYLVAGKMTMHGETKDVELEMRQLGSGKGPGGKERTGFFLQKTIKRSEFGMNGNLKMIGDDVSITISFEGIKK